MSSTTQRRQGWPAVAELMGAALMAAIAVAGAALGEWLGCAWALTVVGLLALSAASRTTWRDDRPSWVRPLWAGLTVLFVLLLAVRVLLLLRG